jgi:hypothetical protein
MKSQEKNQTDWKMKDGKLILKYFLISMLSPIAILWIGIILGHLNRVC